MKYQSKYYVFIPILLVVILYSYSLTFQLINLDDHHLMSQLRSLDDFSSVLDQAFNKEYLTGAYYRPVITISFWIDLNIAGGVLFLHLSNVIMHIIAVLLVYLILLQITKERVFAVFGSSFFAVHPLFANAVSWTLGRNDLMLGMFLLLSFYLFIKYIKANKYIYLILHLIAYMLSVLSKETGILLPMVCLAYLLLYHKETLFTRGNIFMAFGWMSVFILWYILRSNAVGDAGSEIISLANFFENIRIIPEFIGKFFLPVDITVLPAFRITNTLIGVLIILALSLLYYMVKNKDNKLLIMGILWFFIFTIPGMFSRIFTDDDFFHYFDCRAYVPSFGLLLIIYSIIFKNLQYLTMRKIYMYSAIVIILLLPVTILESSYYKNPLRYWKQAVKEEPERARYWFELGANAGRANKHDAAEKFLLKAAKLNPTRPEFYLSLGDMMIKIKEYQKAENYLYESIERFPTWLPPQLSLAETLFLQKKYRQTINVINIIFNNNKIIPELIPNLINCYMSINEYDNAMIQLDKYSKTLPNIKVAQLYNQLGVRAIENNKNEMAIKCWERSYRYNPNEDKVLMNIINYWKYYGKDENKVRYYENLLNDKK